MLKRIITLLFCLFLIFVSTPICYATDAPTGYTPATSDTDLAQSFNDYCKSRDAEFTSSMPGAAYTYIYNYIKEYANYAGYNIDELQEGLYKSLDQSGVVGRWYMSTQMIGFYNDLFAYLINENELQVGDTADINMYAGDLYTDQSGNSCLVYYLNQSSINVTPNNTSILFANSYSEDLRKTKITKYGTYYAFQKSDYANAGAVTVPFNGKTYTIPILHNQSIKGGLTSNYVVSNDYTVYNITQLSSNYSSASADGNICVFRTNDGLYNLGFISYSDYSYPDGSHSYWIAYKAYGVVSGSSSNLDKDINIIFTTNNNVINNNIHEGDTIITNEGDVINNNPDPGGQDPGWDVGGGQGTYDPDSHTITFPDFNLPDLNIDWSISGLGNKFPFSIPFDIASLVTVLNAEPEAPRFQGTMDLGITTYVYDIDLSQFDSVAHACRIAELLLLVFGLILITRSIIKG